MKFVFPGYYSYFCPEIETFERKMKIRHDVKIREMAGEHIVVMPGRYGADMTRVVALNASSLYLWEALGDRDFTVEDAARLLVERYDVDDATALRDAGAWLERLRECGVVED